MPDEWLKYAILALKATLGFEWQGDNLLIARENILYTILEYYKFYCTDEPIDHETLLELSNIISWNIWQMDGLKFVIPMSCKTTVTKIPLLDGTFETYSEECSGCRTKNNQKHNGTYCKIMDWNTGKPVEFRAIVGNKAGYGY